MAILFIDSFSHYATADLASKGWTNTSGTIGASSGRFAGAWTGGNAICTRSFTGAATIICGIAWRYTSALTAAAKILRFQNGGTVHATVQINTSGRLEVIGADGSTVRGTGTTVLTQNVWYYIEAKVLVSDAAGTIDVKLNEVNEVNVSSIDTKNGATTTIDTIAIGASAAITTGTCDLYIADTSGSAPTNTFLGDCRVEAIFPSTAGASAQWTPLSSTNVSNVDETAPDGDTSYNSSSTANQVDSFNYTNITPTSATVYAIQYALYARKDDAGTRTIAPLSRHSSTDYASATTHNLSTSFAYYLQVKEQNPGTSAAWTVSDVNGDEFGYKEIA